MSENETMVGGIVPAKDGVVKDNSINMENIVDYKVKVGFGGRVKVVLSFASESPALLGAEACDKNDVVKDVPEAKSGSEASLDESILKKDPAAEKDPAADAVDSDKAKAMFSAHAPSQPADFWSKLKRPAAGAIKGALKKDIPAAKSGAEASFDETGGIKNDPALKPVTEDAPAFKPVTAGGAPLPPIKEFSAEGDADWTVSAGKEFPAEEPAPAGIADWTAPSNPRRNNGRKGEVKSTTVSNKYDLLDDVETNLAAENAGDEDEKKSKKKGKEMGAESGKESSARPPPESVGGTGKAPRGSTPSTTHSGATVETTTTATPEGSVSASGWLSWPKLCWHNALCAVFICLIAVSAGGGAFVYFSHGSDSLLPSIVPDATALPTERGPLFAPFNPTPDPVVPDPPDVVNDPAWLIATSGFCSNLNVAMIERDIEGSKTAGDRDGHFIADIEFNYYPQTAVKFTDFPYHIANTIEGEKDEADALVSPAWDHKNIALLEPTSTCGVDEQSNQAWGVSVFKVKEHRACADGETAWEGHPCVHYSGYVSAETSNFVNVNEGRFVCQLFVDSIINDRDQAGPDVQPDKIRIRQALRQHDAWDRVVAAFGQSGARASTDYEGDLRNIVGGKPGYKEYFGGFGSGYSGLQTGLAVIKECQQADADCDFSKQAEGLLSVAGSIGAIAAVSNPFIGGAISVFAMVAGLINSYFGPMEEKPQGFSMSEMMADMKELVKEGIAFDEMQDIVRDMKRLRRKLEDTAGWVSAKVDNTSSRAPNSWTSEPVFYDFFDATSTSRGYEMCINAMDEMDNIWLNLVDQSTSPRGIVAGKESFKPGCEQKVTADVLTDIVDTRKFYAPFVDSLKLFNHLANLHGSIVASLVGLLDQFCDKKGRCDTCSEPCGPYDGECIQQCETSRPGSFGLAFRRKFLNLLNQYLIRGRTYAIAANNLEILKNEQEKDEWFLSSATTCLNDQRKVNTTGEGVVTKGCNIKSGKELTSRTDYYEHIRNGCRKELEWKKSADTHTCLWCPEEKLQIPDSCNTNADCPTFGPPPCVEPYVCATGVVKDLMTNEKWWKAKEPMLRKCPNSCSSTVSREQGVKCCQHNDQSVCTLNHPGSTCSCDSAKDEQGNSFQCMIYDA